VFGGGGVLALASIRRDAGYRRPVAGGTVSARRDLLWLAAIAIALTTFWLVPYVANGLSMPIGPDVPVYVWWGRLAEAQGIGTPGPRPGVTVVLVTLSNAFHIQLLTVIGGVLIAGGVALAVTGGLLLRAAEVDRWTWVLGAVLAGLYARFLIWGYLANLLFALLFLAAVVVLVEGRRVSRWAAAALFGAAGLNHPYFFVFGAGILVLMALGQRFRDPEARWVPLTSAFTSLAAGGAIAALGVGLTFLGPQHGLSVAPDAILRKSGLRSLLPEVYRIRTQALLMSDGWWLLLEGVFAVGARLQHVVGRFLGAWAACTLLIYPFTLILPVFAGQRLVFFGFFLPLLAAVGLVKFARRFTPARRVLVLLAVVGAVTFETAGWWWPASPFFTEEQLRQASIAGKLVSSTPPGTPVVVVVREENRGLVLPAEALNALRTSVPPDRIPDVFAYFGAVDDVFSERPSSSHEPLRALQVAALDEISAVGRAPFVVVLSAFNDDPKARDLLRRAGPDVFASRTTAAASVAGQPEPTSPAGIAGTVVLVELILVVAGLGWARTAGFTGAFAWGLAPAFGVAGVILLGAALYVVGFPINSVVANGCVVAVAGGGIFASRRRSSDSPHPSSSQET
jgi:hypothetical protein